MPNSTAAAIYARISSDRTGEGLGVERQLEDCRKHAAARGWTVAEEYVDNDISAYGGKLRPAYQRMLADVAAGERDAVIVYHTDRLTRRPIELEEFLQVCDRARMLNFSTASGGDIDIANGDGLLMLRMLAAFAAQESARKSDRLKRKAIQKAESGEPNGGNFRPFGYEKDRVTVIDSEAAAIRLLVDRLLAGESLQSLTRWLQDEGIQSVANKPWRTNVLREMLGSARIAGLRAHKGEVVGPAVWPAIITPQKRDQVLALLESKRVSGRRTPTRYLLSGMLRCGRCGHKLYSSARENTRRYVCSSSADHGGCGRLTIVASSLEEFISDAVLYRLDTPVMEDALAGRVAADERHSALLAELEIERSHSQELATMYGQRIVSQAEWIAARQPIEARISTLDRQLSQMRSNNALDGIVGQGNTLRTSWAALNLSRQVAIVAAVLDYATIQPATRQGMQTLDPARVIPTWRL